MSSATRRVFSAMLLISTMALSLPRPAAASEPSPADRTATKKWATDAPLRQGMTLIAEAVLARQQNIAKGDLPSAAYVDLANKATTEISNIVDRSKLEPKADQMFRYIILDMNQAIQLMRVAKPELQRAGALALIQALRNYGQSFDHPGWTQPAITTANAR